MPAAPASTAEVSIARSSTGRRSSCRPPDQGGHECEHGHQSSTRSRAIVANAEVALRPSRRASRYGTQHLARARGQDVRHGEADHRCPQRRGKTHGPDRLQQVAPPHGANHHHGDEERARDEHLGHSRRCIRRQISIRYRVAQKPREQGNRQNRDGNRARSMSHQQADLRVLGSKPTTTRRTRRTGPTADTIYQGRFARNRRGCGNGCAISRWVEMCALRTSSVCARGATESCRRARNLRCLRLLPCSHVAQRLRAVPPRARSATVYDPRRRAADRRHRPHLRVRLRARLGHSRQGQGAHAAVGVLVRSHGATSCRITCSSTDVADVPAGCAPYAAMLAAGRCWCARPSRCRSSASRAAICPGSGWKDYQATGAVCGMPLPAGLRESDRLPAADLHAGDQGRAPGTT